MDGMANISHNMTSLEVQEIDTIPRPVVLLIRLNGCLVILLNGFVLVFILCNRKIFREQILWMQMISLCLNDTFAGVSTLVVSFIDNQPFFSSRVACRLVLIIALTSQLTTLCNIFAIGVHRIWILKRISLPVNQFSNYRPFIFQNCLNVCIGTAFTVIAVFGWSIREDSDNIAGCEFTAAYGRYKSKATLFISCLIFIPLFLTNILYVVAFVMLKRSLRAISPIPEQSTMSSTNTSSVGPNGVSQQVSDKKRLSRERNALLIIFIVLVAMDIFTLPTIVMQMNTVFFAKSAQLSRSTKLSVASTITFNSFINPFIYIIRLPEFRRTLREYLRHLWR